MRRRKEKRGWNGRRHTKSYMIAKNRVLSLWSQNKKLSLRQFGPATAVAVLLLYCGIDYCCTTAALYSSTAAVHHGSEVPIQYVLLYSSVYII